MCVVDRKANLQMVQVAEPRFLLGKVLRVLVTLLAQRILPDYQTKTSREHQRMLLYQGRIAGQVTPRRAPLLDTVVEPEELVLFFVLGLQAENAETFRTNRHVGRPESAVQPVYVRWRSEERRVGEA